MLTKGAASGSGVRYTVPTIGDFMALAEIAGALGAATAAAGIAAGAATGAAAKGAATAVIVRDTRILRSPSATSISLSPVSFSIAANSRTRSVSTCMLPVVPVFAAI